MTSIDLGPLIKIFKKNKLLVYRTNEFLIRPGENPSNIFLIKRGIVRKYFISKQGNESTLTLYKENDFFPWTKLLNQFPNDYYYEAITPVEAYLTPSQEVEMFIKNNNHIAFNLFLNRINTAFHDRLRLSNALTGNAYLKTVLTLIYLAENAPKVGKTNLIIAPRITQEKIASIASLSRERISIEMDKLIKKKLITYNTKQIRILNFKKLKEEVE